MKTKPSAYGIANLEIYVNGTYCGLCHGESLPELQALERAVRRSAPLRRALAEVMVRPPSYRPLGGFAGENAAAKALTGKNFGMHVWADPVRGVLWSPVAWSLVLRISKVRGDEIYSVGV